MPLKQATRRAVAEKIYVAMWLVTEAGVFCCHSLLLGPHFIVNLSRRWDALPVPAALAHELDQGGAIIIRNTAPRPAVKMFGDKSPQVVLCAGHPQSSLVWNAPVRILPPADWWGLFKPLFQLFARFQIVHR